MVHSLLGNKKWESIRKKTINFWKILAITELNNFFFLCRWKESITITNDCPQSCRFELGKRHHSSTSLLTSPTRDAQCARLNVPLVTFDRCGLTVRLRVTNRSDAPLQFRVSFASEFITVVDQLVALA